MNGSTVRKLPSFLVIGAAKSATTWLTRELGRHPSIFTYPNEVHYFSRHATKPLAWYEGLFARAVEPLVGEHSNTYLYTPEAPRRILAVLPNARLVAVLRSPVDRAYSAYCMQLARGRVSSRIEEVLDPYRVSSPSSSAFLKQGLYALNLSNYLNHFDESQLKIVLFDDLVTASRRVLYNLTEFLGVAPRIAPLPGGKLNVRRERVLYPWVRSTLNRLEAVPSVRTALHRLTNHQAVRWTSERLLGRGLPYPPLSSNLRRALSEFYENDIRELERITHRNLEAWTKPEP